VQRGRRLLLVAGGAAAVTGILAGLARLGVGVGWGPGYAALHGPLLVVGLFTTVISLERAVALDRTWALAVPASAAAAGLAMLVAPAPAPWLAVASAAGLIAIGVAIVRRLAAAFTWMMLVASVLLLAGHGLWAAGSPVKAAVPLWMAFFVPTIAAERLELSRMAPTPPWAHRLLVVLAAGLAGLSVAQSVVGRPGADLASALARATGVTIAAIGAWQIRFDLSRRTFRHPGQPRYIAAGVQAGAAWLVVSGATMALRGLPPAGPVYDAALHGVFVGYVFSMVRCLLSPQRGDHVHPRLAA
jgi:hypothetical protein